MAAGSAFTISRIGQVAVNVHDLEAATVFYRDTLGLPFLFAAANKMAFFQCGDVRLMLVVPDKPDFDRPSSVIHYTVDDIRRAYEGLTARGARFEGAPHHRRDADTRPVDDISARPRSQSARTDERSTADLITSVTARSVMHGSLHPS